jgi:nickel transport protein
MHVLADVEGNTIRGEAYFSGRGKAKGVTIEVLAPGGRELGRTRTDDDGTFSFHAKYRCDHTIVAVTGDGHRATCTLKADELPSDLLPLVGSTGPQGGTAAAAPAAQHAPAPSSAPSADQTARLVERVVRRQLRPIRRRIEEAEERVRLHDILGGIGYIVGATGLVLYFRSRSRRKG